MTRLIVQDRRNIAAGEGVLEVAMTGCRRDVLAYVARAYPHLHVVAFA